MVGVILKLAGEALVELAASHPGGLSGVRASLQKVIRSDSEPRRSNRLCFDAARALREATVSNPDSIHLKDLDHWEGRVIHEVVDSDVGAEGAPDVVLLDGPLVGDMATSDGFLRNIEITEETMSEGGWHAFQEPGDCWGA